ncbi:hypothetical protein EDB83DRAFT_2527136 [Lactarius deliciosus]|nr:hypothetical protein EDB83DRAFT_2527136 [Lactarius deliciosus]
MTTPPSPMKKQPKRARIASGPGLPHLPPARPNSPTLSVASIENAPMIADDKDGPDNANAILNVVRMVGAPIDAYLAQTDLLKMATLLATLTTFGGVVDPLDVVVVQSVIAHQDDELAVDTLTQRTFEGATVPTRSQFLKQRIALWFRKDSLIHVDSSAVCGLAPPLAFGPEPQASAVWCFEVDLAKGVEVDHITYLSSKLGVDYNGYLFRALNKDGTPLLGKWYLRLAKKTEANTSISDVKYITTWLKERTKGVVVEGSVWYEETCCVCWQSDLHGRTKNHHGGACPTIATFNKVRKAVNLTPITIAENVIGSSLQKEPIKVEKVAKDFEKTHKELKGEVAALTKRVIAVETKCGIKCGAETGESSTPPKRQKRAKSKERTKGKAEEKPATPQKPVASGSDKGKGKAT